MKIKLTSRIRCLICFLTVISVNIPLHGQDKIIIEKEFVSFTSNAPLELIKASSDKIRGVIDPSTNEFAFIVNIRSFKGFNNGLQFEHFNEKYMESEKYPTASFKGKIIEKINFSLDGIYDVRAKGDLEIHGQKQIRIIKCRLIIRNGVVNVESNFIVPLADHNISIPRIVNEKIASEIEVSINTYTNIQP